MKGLFSFLEKDDALTAVRKSKTPSDAAYAASILMLSELIKVSEQMRQQQSVPQVAHRLKRLGLNNAFVSREQRQHSENTAILAFMLDMWRDLGTHAILVRLDDFRAILRKHDLMCAGLDDYYGDVPTSNIAEIERADWQSEESRLERYFEPITYPQSVYYDTEEQFRDLLRFPFKPVTDRRTMTHIDYEMVARMKRMRLIIAAPKEFMALATMTYRPETEAWTRKAQKDGLVNVVEKPVPQSLPYNYDPFICSLCKHGVIIHSMWGAEAEDAAIKRYQELRDTIIGNTAPTLPNHNPLLLKGGAL